MILDASQHVSKPCERINAVDLGGLDQGVDGGGASAAFVGSGEGPVAPAGSDGPHGALGGVVAHAETAVVEEAHRRAQYSHRFLSPPVVDHAPTHAVLPRHLRHRSARLCGSPQNGLLLFKAESPATLDRPPRSRQRTPVTHRRDTCSFRSVHPVIFRSQPMTARRPSPGAYLCACRIMVASAQQERLFQSEQWSTGAAGRPRFPAPEECQLAKLRQ